MKGALTIACQSGPVGQDSESDSIRRAWIGPGLEVFLLVVGLEDLGDLIYKQTNHQKPANKADQGNCNTHDYEAPHSQGPLASSKAKQEGPGNEFVRCAC